MDHDAAERLRAPERYVIGELSASERDEFEEHFADCKRCLDDVWTATVFAANAREVFRAEAARKTAAARRPGWWERLGIRPMPALAFSGAVNLLLFAGLAYSVARVQPGLRSELRELSAPRATEVIRVPGLARAAIPTVAAAASQGSVVLSVDLPREFPQYSYTIRDSSGAVRMGGGLQVPQRAESVSLIVPVGTLGPGEYQFQLNGGDGAQSETIAVSRLQVRPN